MRCGAVSSLLAVLVVNAAARRISIGTVQRLSGNLSDTRNILAGYRLWAEQTNLAGGIQVGNVSMEVDLKIYDSEGDEQMELQAYRRLVERDGVDFLLGGATSSAKAMRDAGLAKKMLAISARADGTWDTVDAPHVFTVYPNSTYAATLSFVKAARSTWGLRRLALIWHENMENSKEECAAVAQSLSAEAVDVDVIYQGGIEGELPADYEARMREVQMAGVDMLVSCLETPEQATRTVIAAKTTTVLRGWSLQVLTTDQDNTCTPSPQPELVEGTELKFMYFTAGAATEYFYEQLDGWSQKMLGPVTWHRDALYADPFFTSSHAVNALWMKRADLGDGMPMGSQTASAMAAGVALRLAIEAAGTLESSAVIEAMRRLDAQTFFGRIRFGHDGSNIGITAPVVQWDCRSLTHCDKVLRLAESGSSGAAREPMQPFHQACPPQQIHASTSTRLQVYTPDVGPDGEPALPTQYHHPPCIPCMQGNMTQLTSIRADDVTWGSFINSCEEFAQTYMFGAALMASPGDEEGMLGVAGGITMVQNNFVGLSLMRLKVEQPDVGVSLPWGDRAAADLRAELASVSAAVETSRPLGWTIWNAGLPEQLEINPPGDACPGGGPQVTWGPRAVCMTPAVRLQGHALAQLVEHFHWNRCHLVVSSGLAFEQILREFERVAGQRAFHIAEIVRVPAEQGPMRDAAFDQLAALDDCQAGIVVLLTSRWTTEEIFDKMYGGEQPGWSGRKFVPIGTEAASRAHNAPVGMLGVRTVGLEESHQAAEVLSGSGRTWGTGVLDSGESGSPHSEVSESSPWLDIAVEDRRLFAADAALTVAVSTWLVLSAAADVGEAAQIETGVQQLSEIGLEGATGPLKFAVAGDNTTESPRVLERIAGRLAFVNRREHAWVSVATLDLDGTLTTPVVHTINGTLGQRAWEQKAIEWGLARHRGGGKPGDACECVLWSKMPPNLSIQTCAWSVEAMSVVVVGVVLVFAIVGGVCYWQRKRMAWWEWVVAKRMKELRVRLRLRKRDGFVLSTEGRGLNLFGREIRVVQRKQLEALARMTLLFDFETRALDSLAWTLLSPSGDKRFSQTYQLERVISSSLDPAVATQYAELRAVLLETSKVLLDPSIKPGAVAETVGRSPPGASKLKWLQSLSPKTTKEEEPPLYMRELVGHVGFREDNAEPNKSWSPASIGRGSRGGSDEEEAPETIEDRFNFFCKQVAQVQVWQEDHHSLFKELKEGPVQEFMNTLHQQCDALFQAMLKEDQGLALVAFQYPQPKSADKSPIPVRAVEPAIGNDSEPAGADQQSKDRTGDVPTDAKDSEASASPSDDFGLVHIFDPLRALFRGPVSSSETPSLPPKPERATLAPPPRAPPAVETAQTVATATADAAGVSPVSMSEVSPSWSVLRPLSMRSDRGSREDDAIVIRRQDHPRVRAIRLNEEDWREVDLELTSSFKLLSAEGGTLGEVVRPVKDEEVYISQLYRRAVLLNDEFQLRVRRAVEQRFVGRVAVHGAPVKTKTRMREKLLCYAAESSDYAGEPEPTQDLPLAAYILDPIRATVVCDGPAEMLEVARWLVTDGESEGLPVVRVKNKFAVPDASEYDGYRDLMVCALYTGSHDLSIIGEIQIHDRRLHSLKLQMHKLYKCKRATKATMI